MRVAINAWFLEQGTTGSGQYLTHLLPELSGLAADDEFVLIAGRGSQLAGDKSRIANRELYVVNCELCGWSENLTKVWFEQIAFPPGDHTRQHCSGGIHMGHHIDLPGFLPSFIGTASGFPVRFVLECNPGVGTK